MVHWYSDSRDIWLSHQAGKNCFVRAAPLYAHIRTNMPSLGLIGNTIHDTTPQSSIGVSTRHTTIHMCAQQWDSAAQGVAGMRLSTNLLCCSRKVAFPLPTTIALNHGRVIDGSSDCLSFLIVFSRVYWSSNGVLTYQRSFMSTCAHVMTSLPGGACDRGPGMSGLKQEQVH